MSAPARSRSLALKLGALVLLAPACRASAPPFADGGGQVPPESGFPTLASCAQDQPCPGGACATNALGPANGQTVDLGPCRVLQLTFTTGMVIARVGEPDLALHAAALAGVTRVEASRDSVTFKVVGFVGEPQYGAPEECRAAQQAGRFLIDLDRCNLITDVSVVRLNRDETASGALAVDALEALSFEPIETP